MEEYRKFIWFFIGIYSVDMGFLWCTRSEVIVSYLRNRLFYFGILAKRNYRVLGKFLFFVVLYIFMVFYFLQVKGYLKCTNSFL